LRASVPSDAEAVCDFFRSNAWMHGHRSADSAIRRAGELAASCQWTATGRQLQPSGFAVPAWAFAHGREFAPTRFPEEAPRARNGPFQFCPQPAVPEGDRIQGDIREVAGRARFRADSDHLAPFDAEYTVVCTQFSLAIF
jgi:hypothetical protein